MISDLSNIVAFISFSWGKSFVSLLDIYYIQRMFQ